MAVRRDVSVVNRPFCSGAKFAISGVRKTSAQTDVRPKALSADFQSTIHWRVMLAEDFWQSTSV